MFLSLFISVIIFLGYNSYKNSHLFIETQKQISKQNTKDEVISTKLDQILEKLTIGVYNSYSKDQNKLNELKIKSSIKYEKSLYFLYYFFATVILGVVMFFLLDKEMLIIFVAISALVSLVFALISPLLMMMIHNSFPIVGEIILSFESKTVITTIEKLFHDKNYIVGIVMFLFSIFIPLLKGLFLLFYGILKETGLGEKLVYGMNKLGKWSMVDVFVVAILVVFFSTKQDIHSSLKIEVGLYFFIGYVLLSMYGSTLISLKDKSETTV
jgi:hypothetical protein